MCTSSKRKDFNLWNYVSSYARFQWYISQRYIFWSEVQCCIIGLSHLDLSDISCEFFFPVLQYLCSMHSALTFLATGSPPSPLTLHRCWCQLLDIYIGRKRFIMHNLKFQQPSRTLWSLLAIQIEWQMTTSTKLLNVDVMVIFFQGKKMKGWFTFLQADAVFSPWLFWRIWVVSLSDTEDIIIVNLYNSKCNIFLLFYLNTFSLCSRHIDTVVHIAGSFMLFFSVWFFPHCWYL